MEEFKGDARMKHVIFRNGTLRVPKRKQTLQKLLSLYHPLKDVLYEELQPVKRAEEHLDWLEFEIAAMNAANNLDVDNCEYEGVLGTLGGIIGSIQANEVVKEILNIGNSLCGYMLIINLLDLNFRKAKI